MSQSSQTTTETSPQSTDQQNTKRKTLPGLVWFALIAALVLVVIFAITPSLISAITYVRTFNTAAPNPTATVTAAQLQDLSNRANQEMDQTNSLLNLMTSFATVMGAVLAVFAVVTVGLGAIGYFSNNAFEDLKKEWRSELDKLKKETVEEQEKIHALQIETSQKQQILNTLVNDMESKVRDLEKDARETNAYALVTFGNLLLEQGRGNRAVQVFEKALKERPDDPEINYLLGRAYSGLPDFEKAFQYLGDAIKAEKKEFPEAHMELGLAYRRRGNMRYEKALLESDEWKKNEWLSKAQDDYKQAVQHLTQAITMRSGYEDALATLGGLYRRLGAYENNDDYFKKAQEYYESAFKAKPNSSYALANVASFLWYFGNYEDALNTFARVKVIAQERIDKPEDPTGIHWDYYDLALSQLAQGETELAKETYTKAIEKTRNPIDFDGVLSNFKLLKASKTIKGLDDIIAMVEAAKSGISKTK